jgi:hypothetical protein
MLRAAYDPGFTSGLFRALLQHARPAGGAAMGGAHRALALPRAWATWADALLHTSCAFGSAPDGGWSAGTHAEPEGRSTPVGGNQAPYERRSGAAPVAGPGSGAQTAGTTDGSGGGDGSSSSSSSSSKLQEALRIARGASSGGGSSRAASSTCGTLGAAGSMDPPESALLRMARALNVLTGGRARPLIEGPA